MDNSGSPQGGPCEDTLKRQPSLSQEKGPPKKTNLPAHFDLGLPGSRTVRKETGVEATWSVGSLSQLTCNWSLKTHQALC